MTQYKREETFVTKVLKEQGYSDLNIVINKGDGQKNYFGSVYRITVKGIKNNEASIRHLFLKTHSDSKERNERVKIKEKFQREAFIYSDVLSEYNILQKDISVDEILHFASSLYADEEWLLLEELKSFQSPNEKLFLDFEHMKIMMKDIAKFHALSFAIKQTKPNLFEKVKKLEFNRPNIVNKERSLFIAGKVWQWTLEAVEDDLLKTRLQKIEKDVFKDDTRQNEYAVLCHGDYNLRNVMFSFDNKIPRRMVMIDFQLSYMTSPVADIMFAIFSSTDSNLRRKHYLELLKEYYEHLKSFLILLHCIPDSYPKDIYEKDFFTYFPRELITILVVIRLMCLAFKNQNSSNVPTSTIFEYNCPEAEKEFKKRINELISDFAFFGYI